MANFQFNPIEGIFDMVGDSASGGSASFNPDTILTGYNLSGELAVLVDNDGNVLIGP